MMNMTTETRAGAEDIRSRAHRGRNMVTIKRADAEDIRSKGPQRDDNEGSGRRGYTIKGPLREENGDNKKG